MALTSRHRERVRWAALAALLFAIWLAAPGSVPLYDGVAFPDEPYRNVPQVDPAAKPATTATVDLRLTDGVNPGGLVANSAERGPQVSVFAPPQAFAAPATASTLTVAATPVPPTPPLAPGVRVSNSYLLTFRAGDVDAPLRPQAQSPAITMRATEVSLPLPVFAYRPDPATPWRILATQQVGADIFNTSVPAAGEFVLVRVSRPVSAGSTNRVALIAIIGVGVLVVGGALVGLRLAAARREQDA